MRETRAFANGPDGGWSPSVPLWSVTSIRGGAAKGAEVAGANAYFPVSSQHVRAGV